MAAELAVPGFVLIFFGLGAWIAAIMTFVLNVGLNVQITVFIIASLALLFLLRRYAIKTFTGKSSAENRLDQELDEVIGKTARVTKEITPDNPGTIKFRGSFWTASSDQAIPRGASVTILMHTPNDAVKFIVTKT